MKNTNVDQSDLCQVGNLALSADGGENDQGISIIFKHDNIKNDWIIKWLTTEYACKNLHSLLTDFCKQNSNMIDFHFVTPIFVTGMTRIFNKLIVKIKE